MVGYENLDVKLFLLRVLNLSGVTPESYVCELCLNRLTIEISSRC